MQEICEVHDGTELKQKVFAEVFFGRRRRGRLIEGFGRLYPTMRRLIDHVKRHDYRHLAWTLQRIESEIVIDDACEVMRVEYPDVPILTIHDAILTTPESADVVQEVLRSAFLRCGVSPQIKRKDLRPPSADAAA